MWFLPYRMWFSCGSRCVFSPSELPGPLVQIQAGGWNGLPRAGQRCPAPSSSSHSSFLFSLLRHPHTGPPPSDPPSRHNGAHLHLLTLPLLPPAPPFPALPVFIRCWGLGVPSPLQTLTQTHTHTHRARMRSVQSAHTHPHSSVSQPV